MLILVFMRQPGEYMTQCFPFSEFLNRVGRDAHGPFWASYMECLLG